MKFEEALAELRKGKFIKRKKTEEWIHMDQMPFTECITPRDLFEEDWEVFEEPGKTFLELFEAFKEGKKIRCKSWMKDDYIHKDAHFPFSGESILASDWEIIE